MRGVRPGRLSVVRYAVATDEDLPIVGHVVARLRERGHEVAVLPTVAWAKGAIGAAHAVADGKADAGVVFCHTGTGVSIAANKVKGVRAALCGDAETAAGARKWNDANVLALSLRLLTVEAADAIVEAWTNTAYEGTESESLDAIRAAEG
jgi:ribose 5-phosphate isomerase B